MTKIDHTKQSPQRGVGLFRQILNLKDPITRKNNRIEFFYSDTPQDARKKGALCAKLGYEDRPPQVYSVERQKDWRAGYWDNSSYKTEF